MCFLWRMLAVLCGENIILNSRSTVFNNRWQTKTLNIRIFLATGVDAGERKRSVPIMLRSFHFFFVEDFRQGSTDQNRFPLTMEAWRCVMAFLSGTWARYDPCCLCLHFTQTHYISWNQNIRPRQLRRSASSPDYVRSSMHPSSSPHFRLPSSAFHKKRNSSPFFHRQHVPTCNRNHVVLLSIHKSPSVTSCLFMFVAYTSLWHNTSHRDHFPLSSDLYMKCHRCVCSWTLNLPQLQVSDHQHIP